MFLHSQLKVLFLLCLRVSHSGPHCQTLLQVSGLIEVSYRSHAAADSSCRANFPRWACRLSLALQLSQALCQLSLAFWLSLALW